MLILKLAWRNIWRNKRRSILTILAVMFAVFLSVAMRAMQIGTYEANIESSVNMFTGYIQIQKIGFQENQTLTKTFNYTPELESVLKQNIKIIGYTPRIYANGLIGYKENSLGSILFGIDPIKEPKVSTIQKRVKDGNFLSSTNDNEILLGYKMLENLKAKIGDTLVILSSGFDGSMGNQKFRICGTVRMGSPDLDNMTAFININTAKNLLAMNNRISVIAIKLNSLKDIPEVNSFLRANIKDKNIVTLSWDEVMPDIKESIEFDSITGLLFIFILLIVVAFGILNTLLMSITERFKEFGIMLAIGMKQSRLLIILFFETIFLSLIGIVVGNIFAFITNYYLTYNPMSLGEAYTEIMEEYGWLPMMFSTLDVNIFIIYSIVTLITALIVFIYPAYKILKLEALKGIRYT